MLINPLRRTVPILALAALVAACGADSTLKIDNRTNTPGPTLTPPADPTATVPVPPTATEPAGPTVTARRTATTPPTRTRTTVPTVTPTSPPTETSTPVSTRTSTPTSTETATATETPTETATSTSTPTGTTIPTSTQTAATQTATSTPTPTQTHTATATQTLTSTATQAPTVPQTPTVTGTPPTATPTNTGTNTPTSTPTPTATETMAPTNTPTVTPTMSATTCGNGLIERGETCETCPQDCQVLSCTAGTGTVTYDVTFEAPFGETPTSVTVLVANRGDVMVIPGSGIGPTVVQRIGSRPSGSSLIANDLDYGVRVVLTRAAGLDTGRIFTIRFDVCQGETATDVDAACSVEGCSGSFGLIDGCLCSVAIP